MIKPATMLVTLALALMGTGVTVGALGGCEGGSTGFCAPSRDRAPLVWWDLGRHDADVGVGQAQAGMTDLADPTGSAVVLGHGSVSVRVGTMEAHLAVVSPDETVTAGKVLILSCTNRLATLACQGK